MKKNYIIPETEEMTVVLEQHVLEASTRGFVDEEGFDNSGWGLD